MLREDTKILNIVWYCKQKYGILVRYIREMDVRVKDKRKKTHTAGRQIIRQEELYRPEETAEGSDVLGRLRRDYHKQIISPLLKKIA